MNPSPRVLLLAGALLAGCESAAVNLPPHGLPEPKVVELAAAQRADWGEMSALPVVQPLSDSPPLDPPPQDPPPQATEERAAPRRVSPRYSVRKAIAASSLPSIPRVLLSAGHAKLCLAKVGDSFPALNLPRLGGPPTELASLRGQQATVVLFWHPDRWMARTALTDMQRDIAGQFDPKHVSVVGIAVRLPSGSVQATLNQAKATFPQLLDTDGQAFTKVGTAAFPRLYVLDPAGTIVWFDIEYSEGTRRELWQTLQYLTKQ